MNSEVSNIVIAASTGALVPAPKQGKRPPEMTDGVIREGLAGLSEAGFSKIELSDIWVDSRTLPIDDAKALGQAIAVEQLSVIGLSTLGLEAADHALDVAQELGAPTLCLGLHKMPAAPANEASFWANPPQSQNPTEADFMAISTPLAALCKRAQSAGINVVIEMNENAIIDRAAHVLRLVEMTGSDNLGVNPDLGNLTRVTVPMVEPWYETLEALAGLTRYWHVKNNLRLEHPNGFVATHPCAMADGVIDYRTALKMLVEKGFNGPIIMEAYWGDRIHNLETGRKYLTSLVQQVGKL